jgi:transposase
VRVIDFFVDQLDLGQLGFWGVHPKLTGRPAYHPAVMLKLYIYGYLNPSSPAAAQTLPLHENTANNSIVDVGVRKSARNGRMAS